MGNNFLIPNGTFLVEAVVFGLLLLFVWQVVLPPIRRSLGERRERDEHQAAESREVRERVESTAAERRRILDEVRAEAAGIRDDGRARGREAAEVHRTRAREEADRIMAEGRTRLAVERDSLLPQVRRDVGVLGGDLAGKLLADTDLAPRHRGVVNAFASGLEIVDGRLRRSDTVGTGVES